MFTCAVLDEAEQDRGYLIGHVVHVDQTEMKMITLQSNRSLALCVLGHSMIMEMQTT